jgi:hypothetical protein
MTYCAAHRGLSSFVFFFWLCVVVGLLIGSERATAQGPAGCIGCHGRDQVVALYEASPHGKLNIGCDGCHGGDAAQPDKAKAHAGRFIARPDTAATLEMCGQCHSKPLEYFKSSKHIAARANAPRLDCVECHGVHAIGAASESFRWPRFCAGCHGLEYLPQLPKPFREMLALSDDLREAVHRLESTGRAQPDLIARRKEIRHQISELVHKTDAQAGLEAISHILESGAALKAQIASEEKKWHR